MGVKSHFILISLLLCQTALDAKQTPYIQIDHLQCDYRTNPLGIDEDKPHFFWTFKSVKRNQYQDFYRILVASSQELLDKNLGDIWDSKKTADSENINIAFHGSSLKPFTRYYWKVKTWMQSGLITPWSTSAFFETAFLAEKWNGNWITDPVPVPIKEKDLYKAQPAPWFIKNFTISKKIKFARLYISGLGYYQAYMNGKRTGDQELDPGWTNYDKTVLYSVYNITRMLKPGTNSLRVLLGNGWYNPLPLKLFGEFNLRNELTIGKPALIANLRIEFADGSYTILATNSSWKTCMSFIIRNNIYLGEEQDARLRNNFSNNSHLSSELWIPVVQATPPNGKLVVQTSPPIRITKRFPAIRLLEPAKNIFVADFGQNFAGRLTMKLKGRAGEIIHFRYGELVNPDGRVNGMTTVAGHIKEIWNVNGGPGAPKTAYQEDSYICKGDGTDFFIPHFTFHAFRYVEITGLTEKPDIKNITGLRINADLPSAGYFKCSSPLFNQIQRNTLNTFLSNVFSVQSDCPGRERQGYGADMVTSCEAFIYNFDMNMFYTKTIHDFANDTRPNSGMPECAPYNGITTEGFDRGAGPIEWELAFPFLQEQLYRFYGDKKIIGDNYETTKRLVDFLLSQAKENLMDHGIGDHVAIDSKHIGLTSSLALYHHVKLLAGFAAILNNKQNEEKYENSAYKIASAINQKYLDSLSGTYDTAFNQITQVFPLWYEIVPDSLRSKALGALIEQIREKRKGHFTTGIFGTKMLFDVLRKTDHADIVEAFIRKTDYPGYGYMIQNGATTLWETWEKPEQNSWNHPMFGSVSEWFYRSPGGINPSSNSTGMNQITIKPFITDDLSYVDCSYRSVRGQIISNWSFNKGVLNWQVEIPANVKALVFVPAKNPNDIREDGRAVLNNHDLRLIRLSDGYTEFEAVSGVYHFRIKR